MLKWLYRGNFKRSHLRYLHALLQAGADLSLTALEINL